MANYDLEMFFLLNKIRDRFAEINGDTNLTEQDKKQLKDFYLQHMIAPETRKLLEKCFPNGVEGQRIHHRMTPADRRRRDAIRNSPPNPNTPDR